MKLLLGALHAGYRIIKAIMIIATTALFLTMGNHVVQAHTPSQELVLGSYGVILAGFAVYAAMSQLLLTKDNNT